MSKKKETIVPRGLSELLKSTNNFDKISKLSEKTKQEGKRREISLDKLIPNPFQPRINFELSALEELAQSIKQHGLIQPIIVRRSTDINFYEIIAGERRFRAAKLAGLTKIDVIVQNWDDVTTRQMTLLENIQREDLNHIEIAKSYKSLQDELNVTQKELSKIVSKNRSTVTNFLRLLELPTKTRQLVETNQISGSFARTLLALKDKDLIEKWSTDEKIQKLSVTALDKKIKNRLEGENQVVNKEEKDVHLIEAENKLSTYFDTKVSVGNSLHKGKVIISYDSSQQLIDILKKLDKNLDL